MRTEYCPFLVWTACIIITGDIFIDILDDIDLQCNKNVNLSTINYLYASPGIMVVFKYSNVNIYFSEFDRSMFCKWVRWNTRTRFLFLYISRGEIIPNTRIHPQKSYDSTSCSHIIYIVLYILKKKNIKEYQYRDSITCTIGLNKTHF